MQLKKIVVGLALNLALLSTAANADILFNSMSGDVCSSVPGVWTGTGTVTAKVLGVNVKCQYGGTALVTSTSNPYVFSVDVSLNLISGICPSDEHLVLTGNCDSATGAFALKSSEANLSGKVSEDGNTVENLTGTVDIKIKGVTVTGHVSDMNLHKQ